MVLVLHSMLLIFFFIYIGDDLRSNSFEERGDDAI